MAHKGYVTAPELLARLEQELRKCGVPYRVVTEPEGFGEDVRPVLVTTRPKPPKWTRYSRCKRCGGGTSLDAIGQMKPNCESCAGSWLPTSEAIWRRLEQSTPAAELGLPAWFDGVGAPKVWDVREQLARGELWGVGSERAVIVSEALAAWRQRVIELLTE